MATTMYGQHPILSTFDVQQIGATMRLNWTIKSGSTCNGIVIERSSDGLEFNEIGVIEGICGNVSEPTDYEFYDESPVENLENFYRIELGFQGYSQIISGVYNTLNSEGFLVYPNPSNDQTQVFFRYKQGLEHCFKVFDASGKLMLTNENIESSPIDLSFDQFDGGLYYGVLYVNGELEFVTRMVFHEP